MKRNDYFIVENKSFFSNAFLLIAIIFWQISILLIIGVKYFDSIGYQLGLIISTIFFQIVVILRTKKIYTFRKLNIYFIHPAFFINLAVIGYFFLPLIFYLFNNDIYRWIVFENISIPLTFYCLSIVILNILFIIIDKGTSFLDETKDFDRIINLFKQGLPILITFYLLAWITRILMLSVGAYSLLFANPDLIYESQVKYPILFGTSLFFNGEIYVPVLFVLWILYYTAFKSNKKYKIFMILITVGDILYYLPAGAKQYLLQPILAYSLAGFILKKKIFKKLIIIALIFALSLPLYNIYRVLRGTLKGGMEELKVTQELVYGQQKGYLFSATESVFRRADAFGPFFYLTQIVQNNFLMGVTYRSIISRLIPDFLIPLPEYLRDTSLIEDMQNYRIIRNIEIYGFGIDEQTLIAQPLWGEFYLNFGYPGLVFGLPFLGIFTFIIFRNVLRCIKLNNLIIYSFIPVAFAFFVHGGLALFFTPLIKIAIVLLIINFITKSVGIKHLNTSISMNKK
jgi:hypothetical protein